ncbi:hypothetical protein MUB24_12690 [Lederbergia sp. NSJ-179]|uniref:hypothetical protein n=1 Tax=Lederbergia sp. NSJ-179 TaxID=2931402 RepID=UPI001FD39FA6|nr:hypothetical protein [Lederbergia sp. NSJ-179]MCJ7841739.1 hypothetical protein [Lederbergia sp. NSJ-179]
MQKSRLQKKSLTLFALVSFVTIMLSSQVLATWYTSTITLPRNGWWYTVDRPATSNVQKTKVTNPTYDVVSNIVSLKNVQLSTNKTHKKNQNSIQNHNTGARGANVKAAFRSSLVNQHTNKVNLGWEP